MFKSVRHRERFLGAIADMGSKAVYDGNKLDQEYGTALYILTCDEGIWEQARPYITQHGIAIPVMLEEVYLSTGYRVLVQLAGNLFNNEVHLDPVEFYYLDEDNFEVVLTALHLRRRSHTLEEVCG